MSVFKNKSEINLESADLLHDNNQYPAVAHCAYYSCYQFMMHIWVYKMNKTQKDLDILCNNDKKIGSHVILINQIRDFIKQKNQTDGRNFNNLIIQLKKSRHESDYTEKNIDYPTSQGIIITSKDTHNILKKYQ